MSAIFILIIGNSNNDKRGNSEYSEKYYLRKIYLKDILKLKGTKSVILKRSIKCLPNTNCGLSLLRQHRVPIFDEQVYM